MILIISCKRGDVSTCDVMDWIKYFGKKCFRFNGDEINSNVRINLNLSKDGNNYFIQTSHEKINATIIQSVWYRREGTSKLINYDDIKDVLIKKSLYSHQDSEIDSTKNALYKIINKNAFWLNRPEEFKLNKLIVLKTAQNIGLRIPETLLSNQKSEVIKFKEKHNKIIIKSISYGYYMPYNGKNYGMLTSILTEDIIEKAKDILFPCYIQEYIDKKYELRVFYLNGKCYSMAIFSQNDEQTKIDFRKYNMDKPNRFVPYKIPSDIEDKIKKLMNELGLLTGSLDIIKSINNEYVFLEINPAGQFGMMSEPCNYFLEKEVAKLLISKDYE